jgi:carbamoyltransferase
MNIIGIHQSGLNSSAALVKGGKISAALLEERLRRQKHYKLYPGNAIEMCLKIGNIKIEDVDIFGVAWNPMIHLAARYRAGFSDWVPYGGQRLYSAIHPVAAALQNDNSAVTTVTVDGQGMRYAFVKHHLCHAVTGFFLSPFKKAAYITCDGYGESQTLTWGIGEDNRLTEIGCQYYPNSIGAFYSAFTAYLGFRPDMDEWKLMGASGYGKPKRFASKLRKLVNFSEDSGDLELDLNYFDFYNFERGGDGISKISGLPSDKTTEPWRVYRDRAF